jgi:acyl-CoA synthetase (NDP forming)
MNQESFYNSLFEPRSVAFIGASLNPAKWGFNILHHILKGGYSGNLYPVNPQGGAWFGKQVFKSLKEVPLPVDLAVIVVPKETVPDAIRDCVEAGIKTAVIITAGFGETGAEGKALEQKILSITKSGGIRIVGPNTMGVFSAFPSRMQSVMTSSDFKQGPVAVLSQSGNLGSSIIYRFIRRNIGISRLVSTGNEADLTIEDYLEYLETDDRTKLICLYIEGVRHGRRFIDTVKRISAAKPVILLKGGTGTIGAGAAMSHTGALSGSFAVFRSMCSQANIIMADNIDEMVDVAGLLLSQPEVTGKRIGIVTQGGGWGVISADLCEAAGLEVPPLDSSIISTLDSFLPAFWSRSNPLDLVAPGKVSMITDTIATLLKHSDMDAILLLGLGYMTVRAGNWLESNVLSGSTMAEPARKMIEGEMELLGLIEQQIKQFNKPIIPVIDMVAFDQPGDGNIVRHLDARGILAYSSPEQAIRALVKAQDYYRKRRSRKSAS